MLTLTVDKYYLSPYAMSAYVALVEKQLPFTLATIDLNAGEQHSSSYAQSAVTQRVPMLRDGEFSLTESSAITEYLQDNYAGPPLYPANPQQRARARQIQAWLRSDLLPIRTERPTEVVFQKPVSTPLSDSAESAVAKLVNAATAWLTPHQAHLFDDWCIADTDLALMLNRLVLNGDSVPASLAEYATRQWQRASVQQWLALPRAS